MRQKIELLVIGMWLLAAVVFYYKYDKKSKNPELPVPETIFPKVTDAEKGKRFEVTKVTVLRADVLDITIKNKDRIMAKLALTATDDAKEKVLDLLNNSTQPIVVLREKQSDGRWIVDFFFTNNGKEVSLSEWLLSNNLVYK